MCVPNDPAGCGPQGDEAAMKQTITVQLNNRFNDAERIIGMFSSTGYKIDKMLLLSGADEGCSQLVVVTESFGHWTENFLIRLRQQVRVRSVEYVDGDVLNDELPTIATNA